ncbi:MAG: VTC domain-containing protein, partial [Firmicutes bacterium]|nr:VTC domain-containing protein [Bacillota bacterium]
MANKLRYRHELKFEISTADYYTLRGRLKAVMQSDPHTVDGKYLIRSIYFDNYRDKALLEKINGYAKREKFR